MKWLFFAGVLLAGNQLDIEHDDARTAEVELPGVRYVLDVTNMVCWGRPVGRSPAVLLTEEQCKRLVTRYVGGR